jgi:DNA-binding NarL/FixJ family response regulator
VAVGRRVLLVEPQETSRVQAEQLLGAAGMRVDVVARIDQAQGMLGTSLQTRVPDVLLTGVPAHDPACQSLIEALRAMQPRLRVVELVDDDSAFAFSVPGTDLPARVGRHTLPRTLVPALSQELDAV